MGNPGCSLVKNCAWRYYQVINIQEVDITQDGKFYNYFNRADWEEMVHTGVCTPDDGTGYPAIISNAGRMFEVRGHSVWGYDKNKWDGVIWYNK
jgi:hypothetical protein